MMIHFPFTPTASASTLSVLTSSALALSALALALFTVSPAVAQKTGESRALRVEVRLDPSKSGQERCIVEPEDLWIPKGESQVTWFLNTGDSGGAESGTKLDVVDFAAIVPATSIERVGENRWRATFDRSEELPKTPYDVHVREADGTVTECYPHVAGSTDQGGGS